MGRKKKEVEQEKSQISGLTLARQSLEKEYPGAIFTGNSGSSLNIERFSSQSVGIDRALGGGWPRARHVELLGMEGSGKTTVALHAVAEVQKLGENALYVDMEHALEPIYATTIGVDWDNLLISQPDCGEDALNILETVIRSNEISLAVVDSVAALVPRQELEKQMGESNMGKHAMLMSQAMRKLTGIIHKVGCTIIWINQIRQKVGVVWGNPEVTTGGLGLKFYSTVRVDIRRIGLNKNGTDIVGNRTKIKVVKNKVYPPFREHEFDITYGQGIDKIADLLDTGVGMEIITKSGASYKMDEEALGYGRDKTIELLRSDPAKCEEIYQRIVCP